MVLSPFNPLFEEFKIAFQIYEPDAIAVKKHPVVPVEGGTREDNRLAICQRLRDQMLQAGEPRPAVLVGERNSMAHLCLVLGRVKIVSIVELASHCFCEKRSDRGFSGTRNANKDNCVGTLALTCVVHVLMVLPLR